VWAARPDLATLEALQRIHMGPMGHFGLSPGGHDMSSMGMNLGRHHPGLSSPVGSPMARHHHHAAGLSPVHHAELSRHSSTEERKSPLAPTLIMQVRIMHSLHDKKNATS
jgi:hypothetical protein